MQPSKAKMKAIEAVRAYQDTLNFKSTEALRARIAYTMLVTILPFSEDQLVSIEKIINQ